MDGVATIENPDVARKILAHLGLSTREPPKPKPWTRQPSLPTVQSGYPYDGIDPPSLFE